MASWQDLWGHVPAGYVGPTCNICFDAVSGIAGTVFCGSEGGICSGRCHGDEQAYHGQDGGYGQYVQKT